MIEVLLPLKTVGGLNAREHWRARSWRVKCERQSTRLLLLPHSPHSRHGPLPCVVTMTRLSSGTLDDDNLQGACKAIRDGVADWLQIDDRDSRVTWRYAQERCKRGEYGVRVKVEAA